MPKRPGTPAHDQGTDDDVLVSCKKCFRPTTNAVASSQHGLCATCHRDTGLAPEEDQ